jgi:hypothetical protein
VTRRPSRVESGSTAAPISPKRAERGIDVGFANAGREHERADTSPHAFASVSRTNVLVRAIVRAITCAYGQTRYSWAMRLAAHIFLFLAGCTTQPTDEFPCIDCTRSFTADECKALGEAQGCQGSTYLPAVNVCPTQVSQCKATCPSDRSFNCNVIFDSGAD